MLFSTRLKKGSSGLCLRHNWMMTLLHHRLMLSLNMKLFLDVFGNNLSVEEINDTMCIVGVVR